MSAFPLDGSKQRVLLTGARSPAGPDLVHWLTRLGHRVEVADSIRWPLTRATRAACGFRRYPSPRRDFAAFAAWFRQHSPDFDVIWPGCEEVLWLAQVPELPLFAPPFELLKRVHGKDSLGETVNGLCTGVASPLTAPLPATREVPASFVAKPRHGRFGHQTIPGPTRLPPTIDPRDWIIQARVTGRERCLHIVANAGTVLALALYSDPRRRSTGPCTVFQREHDAELSAFATAFCAHHQWTACAGFDILTDAVGRHWVVDINPRLTSGLHLIARPHAQRVALLPWQTTRGGECALGSWRDPGPLLLAPITVLELLARFGSSAAAAATADLQWP